MRSDHSDDAEVPSFVCSPRTILGRKGDGHNVVLSETSEEEGKHGKGWRPPAPEEIDLSLSSIQSIENSKALKKKGSKHHRKTRRKASSDTHSDHDIWEDERTSLLERVAELTSANELLHCNNALLVQKAEGLSLALEAEKQLFDSASPTRRLLASVEEKHNHIAQEHIYRATELKEQLDDCRKHLIEERSTVKEYRGQIRTLTAALNEANWASENGKMAHCSDASHHKLEERVADLTATCEERDAMIRSLLSELDRTTPREHHEEVSIGLVTPIKFVSSPQEAERAGLRAASDALDIANKTIEKRLRDGRSPPHTPNQHINNISLESSSVPLSILSRAAPVATPSRTPPTPNIITSPSRMKGKPQTRSPNGLEHRRNLHPHPYSE